MPASFQTPGVYVVEQNAFPNSVVEVATAIPAFIGYTQFAAYSGKDLTNVPTSVGSLKEFEALFGVGYTQPFTLAKVAAAGAAGAAPPAAGAKTSTAELMVAATSLKLAVDATASYTLTPTNTALYYLYNAIRLFYLNGGSSCYIVSIGPYDESASTYSQFNDAIDTLINEQDPTMVLCPDALRLDDIADYNNVMTYMLAHCEAVQSRVALFDVYKGAVTDTKVFSQDQNAISDFRDGVGMNNLNYGITYFPWVNSSIISDTDITFLNLDEASLTLLQTLLNPTSSPAGQQAMVPKLLATPNPSQTENIFTQAIALLKDNALPKPASLPANYDPKQALAAKRQAIQNSLTALYQDYKLVMKDIAAYLNTLPVSPAMAGVYTAVDSSRGVWKAPANVSLNGVVSPTVALGDTDQAKLNVDAVSGKSINAIRSFKNLGVMVWGARTLDGNSEDWRYVNVRRTMIMIEQSVKIAAHFYVFEPNTANTWVTIKSAINGFLFNLWKQGALAGAVPADAYQVQVGLGSTMTADDIAKGVMNVTVLVAISHPAEFIQLTFQQEMQKS
jgi:phage tail sheath protein FI